MIRIFFLFLLIYLYTPVAAQFSDSTNYYINYAASGNINKTNDGTAYLFNNTLRFNISKKNLDFTTTNSYVYGENNNTKTNNDFYSIADLNFLRKKQRLYYWALANFEKSFSLKINRRFQGGGGVAYKVVDRENVDVTVSDGILYELSDLRETDKYGRNEYETFRNSFRIKFYLKIKESLTINTTDFLQNSLSDKDDYIIKSITTLAFRLNKWLSLTTTANYNRLNLTGTENLLITYGLSMEKYF